MPSAAELLRDVMAKKKRGSFLPSRASGGKGVVKRVMEVVLLAVHPKVVTFVTAALAVGFALFQKRMLPPKLANLAAKFYFTPTLPLTYARLVLLPPRAGLWTEIDDAVIVGAAPVSILGHPRRLRALGVGGVVNCCAEYEGPTNWAEYGIEHLRVPTIDHVEPSVADLDAAVRFIDRLHARGLKCYVHCKAGHGRSAAVAFSWLCHRHFGSVAPFDLYKRIAAKRKVRKNLWRQPNILAFYESLPLADLTHDASHAPVSDDPTRSDLQTPSSDDDDDPAWDLIGETTHHSSSS